MITVKRLTAQQQKAVEGALASLMQAQPTRTDLGYMTVALMANILTWLAEERDTDSRVAYKLSVIKDTVYTTWLADGRARRDRAGGLVKREIRT
jgi:hypothetical protein